MTSDAAIAVEAASVEEQFNALLSNAGLTTLFSQAGLSGLRVVVGYDCTHDNINALPAHALQVAGYDTDLGGGIKWTTEDYARFPGALHIDQDPLASDFLSDYLDIEANAATIAEAPGWYRRALASYHAATRPGQRWPGFYLSAGSVTNLVNKLVAAGISSGPKLIVANWNLNEPQAVADVMNASGPFPVVGIQFTDPGPYDIDVWSEAWLVAVSRKTPPPPPPHAPYPHKTAGTETFAAIAATRNTTVEHLLWETLHAYTAADWASLAKLMSALNATQVQQLAAAIGHLPLAAGTTWYSSNP